MDAEVYPLPPGKEMVGADVLPEQSFNIVFAEGPTTAAESMLNGMTLGRSAKDTTGNATVLTAVAKSICTNISSATESPIVRLLDQ